MRKIFTAFVVSFLIYFNCFSQTTETDMIGKQIPDLTFKTLAGEEIKLGELKGKVIVLNLFFRQCPHCVLEKPFLNEVYQQYEKEDIVFLAISSRDDAATLNAYLQKKPFSFKIVPSPAEAKGKNWTAKTNHKLILENFGSEAYPTNIIVNREGVITYYRKGFTDTPAFKEKYKEALVAALAKE